MTRRTGGDVVVEVLADAGVQVVFGIPSVHNLPIYDALRRDGRIQAVTVRHEQGAIGAADGFARTTGRLGVCLSSTGPGAANAMAGQLEAFASFSPVLHLTGQIDSRFLHKGRGFIHEVPDQLAMLGAGSKTVYTVANRDDIGVIVRAAVIGAMSFPRGPVSVEIPIDFQYATTSAEGHARPRSEDAPRLGAPLSDGTALADIRTNVEFSRAVELLAESRRPLVWAGGGAVASGASEQVAQLVRRLGAGLLTTPNGRGIVSEDDPCCVGNLSWDEDVRTLCREADLLVAIGTRFQGPNTENWTMVLPSRLVQLDVDPAVPGRNYPVEAAIIGDAKLAIAALLEELEGLPTTKMLAEPSWPERVQQVRRSARERLRGTLGAQVGLLDALEDCLEEQTVVVKDATISAYTWGNRLLTVRRARTSIMPNSFAIGLGLPHALGAAVGSHGSPVVLLVGDGGFLVACGELATVAQENLPIVIVVFVDGGYGVVGNIQRHQYGPDASIGVELGRPDFCVLARSFGIPAKRVRSVGAFARSVRSGLSQRRALLIEVDLDAIGPMKVTYKGTSRPPKPN